MQKNINQEHREYVKCVEEGRKRGSSYSGLCVRFLALTLSEMQRLWEILCGKVTSSDLYFNPHSAAV